jgi:hypothetical protein
MRSIVMEYKENPDVVDTVLAAIENIKSRKATFMKAYALNIEFPMVLYNLIVMAIEQSVSFLISVCIQYIKDPESNTISTALDKVAYNNTTDNMLYEQLVSFNNSCSNGDIDYTLKEIIKNGGKIAEELDMVSSNSIDSPYSNSFQKFGDENDPESDPQPIQPVNGCGDSDIPIDEPVNEGILSAGIALTTAIPAASSAVAATATIAPAVIGTGYLVGKGLNISFKAIKFLLGIAIPMMRNITYYWYYNKAKLSDTLSTQAQFLEMNAYKLEYTTTDMDDDKKKKVIARQLKLADKLKHLSNKFAIDNKKAEKDAKKLIEDEAKKVKIKDIESQLPNDISAKSILF